MIPKPKHHIYIKTLNGHLAKVAWIHEFKDFELMIGFYGTKEEEPSLAYEYRDRIVTTKEMMNLKIPHKEAIPKSNIPTDHFTLHKDQNNRPGRFHLRYGTTPKHVIKFKGQINRNSPVILDFFIVTDIPSHYKNATTTPDSTDITFGIEQDNMLAIRGRYSGIDFDMESVLRQDAKVLGLEHMDTIAYADSMLKGYFTYETTPLSQEAIKNKNIGTYFAISFLTEKDKFLLKTFIFS